MLAEGQVIGGVYMGLGEALMEEQAFRRLPPKLSDALVHRNPSMLDYKSLTALDMPEVDVALIVGIIIGTYSSIYTASATALLLNVNPQDLIEPVRNNFV